MSFHHHAAMQTAEPQGPREILLNVRASTTEREQLRQMAADRGQSMSGLVREALAAYGFQPDR